MQEVEYSLWARYAERDLRERAKPQRLSGKIPDFSMAFQPIVNLATREIFAYESLVRSMNGEEAVTVLRDVPARNFFRFDKACRSRGIQLAMQLGIEKSGAALAVNVDPHAAVAVNSHLHLTCSEAADAGFPMDRLILEFIEHSQVDDPENMRMLVKKYQEMGVRIAIDDFGAGYSGLSLLASLKPDIVKLDMGLVSKLDCDRTASVVLRATISACNDLGVMVIAEGVERLSTMQALLDLGVVLQQGYLFARPAFEALPAVNFEVAMTPFVPAVAAG